MLNLHSGNSLGNLFRAIADVVNEHLKSRTVSLENIWNFIQDELDAESGQETVPTDGPMPEGESGTPAYSEPNAFVLDVYADNSGIFGIVTKSDGKLYKVPVTVGADNSITLGAYEEVSLQFAPTTGRQVTVKRTADGQVRWFAMPACTSVLNRLGEIDSRALFDSFVEHAQRANDYPELDFFHYGEQILLGKADWVARDGVAYCASGLFYDTPIAQAAIRALEEDPEYWGLSIAYLPTKDPETIRSKDGIEIPVYNTGINRYISLLPENTAASILTSISTVQEKTRMNEKVQAALAKLTGEDKELLESYVMKLDAINRQAEDMIQRGADAVTTTETHVMETSTPAAAVPVAAPSPTVAAPQESRAITPADLTAILESAEFENKVMEIYQKSMAASGAMSAQQTTQEQQVENSVTPVVEQAPAGQDAIRETLNSLLDKVDSLSKAREAQVQEVLNDLPSRIARQNIIRPRATILPQRLQRQNVDMAAIAAQTLDRMPAKAN